MLLAWLRRTLGSAQSGQPLSSEERSIQKIEKLIASGKMAAAEKRAQQLLAMDPKSVPAYCLLGKLYLEQQRYDQARDHLEKAIDLDPGCVDALEDLGTVLCRKGEEGEAALLYQKLLEIEAEHCTAHIALAEIAVRSGDHDTAKKHLDAVMRCEPKNIRAHRLAGRILLEGPPEEALAYYRQAVQLFADDIELNLRLSLLHISLGNYPEAVKLLEKLGSMHPGTFEVPYHLAQACFRMGRHHQAILHYKEALGINPRSADACLGLGDVYENAGNTREALRAYLQSVRHHPSAYAYIKIANIHMLGNDHENAVKYYRRAAEYDENNPEIYRGIGAACRLLGKYHEAEDALGKSLGINPRDQALHEVSGLFYMDTGYPKKARGHFIKSMELGNDTINIRRNLCAALQAQGDYETAKQCFNDLYQHTKDVVSRWNHGLLQLMTGDFSHGWNEYEIRHDNAISGTRAFRYPSWNGEALTGKTILLYGEQGIGDEIMFASCLQDIAGQAGCCFLECDDRLAALFSRSFPDIRLHGSDRTRADSEQCQAFSDHHKKINIDFQLPVGSLPRYFRKTINDFPHHSGYLNADTPSVDKWRQRLQALGEGPKIGISWRGGVPQTRQYLRSIPLADWLPIVSGQGVHFVSLQYSDCSDEITALSEDHGVTLHHWPEVITNLDETAALITALDLVISVQTTIVHLAGALGRPAWVLVPYSPEWRYMASGKHLPWYPSITVMRQQALRDWSGLIQEVVRQLDQSFRPGPCV